MKRKKTFRELINQNKVEILKDKSSLEKIEKKIDNKYLLRS
ncbi:FbpB family small basic protein [Terrilactibacillus sp. BCM23-1]|uniref:FbpB family small basic protein n=1 Tax=Terrilactibacillus tamarindi TaxID=2599694 RepID=A0A6N8CRJ3_9BACI|nr:FbpB family small basic protein [Terrilactibacillus tamarindi]MTT32802.1 FbpB family small basic protein [Terrilactibacillus tamarindi]